MSRQQLPGAEKKTRKSPAAHEYAVKIAFNDVGSKTDTIAWQLVNCNSLFRHSSCCRELQLIK